MSGKKTHKKTKKRDHIILILEPQNGILGMKFLWRKKIFFPRPATRYMKVDSGALIAPVFKIHVLGINS
jgi:hypothetical protein